MVDEPMESISWDTLIKIKRNYWRKKPQHLLTTHSGLTVFYVIHCYYIKGLCLLSPF